MGYPDKSAVLEWIPTEQHHRYAGHDARHSIFPCRQIWKRFLRWLEPQLDRLHRTIVRPAQKSSLSPREDPGFGTAPARSGFDHIPNQFDKYRRRRLERLGAAVHQPHLRLHRERAYRLACPRRQPRPETCEVLSCDWARQSRSQLVGTPGLHYLACNYSREWHV